MARQADPKRAVMFTVIPWFVGKSDAILNERGHKFVGVATAPGPRSCRREESRKVANLACPGLGVVITNFSARWADMVRRDLHAGHFEPEWREIDWNKPARDVFFQVRSWYGVRDVPRGSFVRQG